MPKTGATLVALVISVLMAGCGNAVDVAPPAGLTGISVMARGDYVINVFVCRDKVDTIEIVRDRQGLKETEENPVVRTYKFSRPLTGLIKLNLAEPAEGWAPRTPTVFEPGKGYIVSGASSAGYDSETLQLNVNPAALSTLVPGSVYVSDDNLSNKLTRYTPAQFAETACS
jgi:hypothetical protein